MVHNTLSDKDKFLQYQHTTSYKNLVKEHNLNDEAIWQVYGNYVRLRSLLWLSII